MDQRLPTNGASTMDRIPDDVDLDPQETQEWLDAMSGVLGHEGRGRAHFLIAELLQQDADGGGGYRAALTTPYVNTIDASAQAAFPGDVALELELELDAYLRWNAMALVLRAGRHSGVGGHIATYASAT